MTNDLIKVKDLLTTRGCSDRTISNYISCLNRFKNYFNGKEVKDLNEDNILIYLKENFIDLGLSAATYNINRAAIRYYYLVNFNISFSKELLPQCKVKNRFPILIAKEEFVKIVNSESNLEHKVWLLLGYGSGLRIDEVANLKISNISSKQSKIRVIGKGNKERYVPLPKITLKFLKMYWYQKKDKIKGDYLFPGVYKNSPHISSKTIQEMFVKVKFNNNLNPTVTFHTLRHSFATEFIKAGGDIWELRTLMGHSSANTTMMYLHMAKDFSNVKSPLDEVSL